MLRVSKIPPGDPTIEEYAGQNRFECITCPYHFVIDKRYSERKYLKKKEVEDVIGGKDAWANVDKTEGTSSDRAPESIANSVRRLTGAKFNVQTKSAGITRPTGTSCRFAVLMSP